MTLLERARDLATKHVALSVSLSLAVLAVLRALYFARFDLPVAFLVLALTNQATLLITTLALFLVIVLSMVWVFDPGGHVNRAHEAGAPRALVFGTTIAVTALLPLIYGSFMTPILVALIIIILISVVVAKIVRARRSKTRPKPKKDRLAWVAGLVAGTVLVVLLGQPWMPSEQITTTPGESVAGYVVGEQAGQLLLLDRSRKPVWVKVSDVSSRDVCEVNWLPPEFRWMATPVNRLGSTAQYVECVDA